MKSNFSPVAISVRSFGHHAEEKHASVSTVDAAFIESAKVIGEKISASPNFSSAYDAAVAEHGVEKAQYAVSTKGVVVPPIVDTLEWLLTSPPNVHQFEEPPVSLNIYLKLCKHFTVHRINFGSDCFCIFKIDDLTFYSL